MSPTGASTGGGAPTAPRPTVGACLAAARARLPRVEADLLTARALGCRRSTLYAFPERTVSTTRARRCNGLLKRRAEGEPIAYILGEREFWSLALRVDARVLIPRPETECLIAAALPRIADGADVLDLGTGSGAVALALGASRPTAHILGVDRDPGCIELAQENAARLGIAATFRVSDWYSAVDPTAPRDPDRPGRTSRFDVIVANPPYVAAGDPHLECGDLRFEPAHALVAGPDGLEALRSIVTGAPERLVPGGWLFVEHGHDQRAPVQHLFAVSGFGRIETSRDLAGIPRVTGGRRP